LQGKARVILTNGNSHEGDSWEYGVRQGKGIYRWVNGDIYEGDFVDGKKEGEGKLFRADGSRYEGPWENDVAHGKGK